MASTRSSAVGRGPTQHSSFHRSTGGPGEWIRVVAVAVGLAFAIQALVVKPYRIPSGSMLPTLAVGERVLVDRIGGRLGRPEVGDLVVFHPPATAAAGRCGVPVDLESACPRPSPRRSSDTYIKRVVAGPGDRVAVRDGRVVRNGEPKPRPSAGACRVPSCNLPRPIVVPPDHFFVMGDNRDESSDSRFWGPVPEEWIVGEAFFTYWPPSRIGPLERSPADRAPARTPNPQPTP